ncbi:15561_t:CDS:2, partial [Dentiscutata erythropus]
PLVLEDNSDDDDNSDSSSTSNNDDIPSAGNQQYWKHEKEVNQIEYLPLVNTENLVQKEMPNESSLLAIILDPRMKNFPFMNGPDHAQQRIQAEFLLKNLYTQLKQDLTNKHFEVLNSTISQIDDEDIFSKM